MEYIDLKGAETNKSMNNSTFKNCTGCKETKAVEMFPKYPNSDLPRARCIQCARDYAKEHGRKNRTRLSAQARIRYWKKRGLDGPPKPMPDPTIKICSKCKEEKAIELFTVNSRNGHRKGECKACALIRTTAWRNANKEKVNARRRERAGMAGEIFTTKNAGPSGGNAR